MKSPTPHLMLLSFIAGGMALACAYPTSKPSPEPTQTIGEAIVQANRDADYHKRFKKAEQMLGIFEPVKLYAEDGGER